ncbi:hypothetical protein DCS_01324 [Drechmeria coniospora]|uniref:Uncharacterized protein n=1 Tax=Drechmeria coniospora TaxID=98403 RepID=A0A151GSU5_DRECN|nr:hypothetical protein DCS_01324 [Drechmeria coniospora]KYK60189.1 hypothetical protein DCS_01324 [Drechmeria coniospora]ODA80133.1 hypothetical protein RJ55_03091 [Drechmeria coniospora]
MPAIPVYSASPISASKASGLTPQTKSPEPGPNQEAAGIYAPPATVSQQGHPPAQPQPGAVPLLAVQTPAPQPFPNFQASPAPTPTPTPTSTVQLANPPFPQPGAVPVPPGRATNIPPPPKAGETWQPAETAQATTMPMPHQMSYQLPAATRQAPGRYTAPATSQAGGGYPVFPQGGNSSDGFSHPSGYQQDVHASELNHNVRSGHNQAAYQYSSMASADQEESQSGAWWNSAKKWAASAGESLAAAENEVWKRINKE